MAKKILMEVNPDGVAKISAHGYEGGTCVDATAELEALFTSTVKPREAVGSCVRAAPDQGETVDY